MSIQIIFVLIMNFIISLIGTLAYSVRLVGVRTGKIAISFALFNVLMLISRTAVTFQLPVLTKYVEAVQGTVNLTAVFSLIIFISSIATIAGAFLIPTFQRLLYKGVMRFSQDKSVPKLLLHSFSKSGVRQIRECAAVPMKENITKLNLSKLPIKIITYNLITVALVTVGALAPIYAMSIAPELRATCLTLSLVINGIATILMSVFVDPQLSVMTYDVIDGKCSEVDFRTCVVGMVGSKTIGTFASFLLLIPASYMIIWIAKLL